MAIDVAILDILSKSYDRFQEILENPKANQSTKQNACKTQKLIVEEMARIKFNLKEEEQCSK